MPFFNAWEFSGRFPDILNDPVKGVEARKLFADAQAMLERIVDEEWLEARAVFGLLRAQRQHAPQATLHQQCVQASLEHQQTVSLPQRP